MGAHIQGDLEVAMAMAQRLEVYHGASDGAKARGEKKGIRKVIRKRKTEKEVALTVQGNEAEEVVQVIKNQPKKQGQGQGSSSTAAAEEEKA